jgi:hypothetical protein
MSDPTRYIDEYTYARISIDVAITYEEVNFIKELFETELKAKSIHLITKHIDELDVDETVEINFESVDSIVVSHLQSIESNTVDKQELINIYQSI